MVRAGNDMDADELAHAACSSGSGVGRGFDGGDIATHDGGDKTGADLLITDELNIRGLYHGVRGLDSCNETLGLDHS